MADQNNGNCVLDPNIFICQLCNKSCDISRVVSVPCCLKGTTCLECSIQHIVQLKKCWDCDNALTPKDIIRGCSIASYAGDMISRITEPVNVPILEQSNHSESAPAVVSTITMPPSNCLPVALTPPANCLPAIVNPSANCLPASVNQPSCLPQLQQQQQTIASLLPNSVERRMPLMVDETLPCGWRRQVKQRKAGYSAGKYEVFIFDPRGKRFQSRSKLRKHFEKTGETSLNPEDFDFSIFGKNNAKVCSTDDILQSSNRKRLLCEPNTDQSEEPVSKQRIIEPTYVLTGPSNIPSISSTTVVVKSEPNATLEDMDATTLVKREPSELEDVVTNSVSGVNQTSGVKKEPLIKEEPIINDSIKKELITEDGIVNEIKEESVSNIKLNEFLAMTKMQRNSIDIGEIHMFVKTVTIEEWLSLDEKEFKILRKAMLYQDFRELKRKILKDKSPAELERTREARFGKFMTPDEMLFLETNLEREKLVLEKYRLEAYVNKRRLCDRCNIMGHTQRFCLLIQSLYCKDCKVSGHQREMITCPLNKPGYKMNANKMVTKKEKESAALMTALKRQDLSWAADEHRGGEAQIAMVLYTNLNHPNLKTDYPHWNIRREQIKKRWLGLPNPKKTSYFIKALENSGAYDINKPKSQEMLNQNIEDLKQELGRLKQHKIKTADHFAAKVRAQQNLPMDEKWINAELMGDKATIAIVLCSNIGNPNLRTECPDWPERKEIIQNTWNNVPPEVKSFYIAKASDNINDIENGTSQNGVEMNKNIVQNVEINEIQGQNPQVIQQSQAVIQQNPEMNQQNPGMNQQNPGMNQQNPGMNQQNPGMNQQNPRMNQQNPGIIQENPAEIQETPYCSKQFKINLLPVPACPVTNPQTDEEKEKVVQYESWLDEQDAHFNQLHKHLAREISELGHVGKKLRKKIQNISKLGQELLPSEAAESARVVSEQQSLSNSMNKLSSELKKHRYITGRYFLKKNNFQKSRELYQKDTECSQKASDISKDELEILEMLPVKPEQEIVILE